MIIEPDSDLFLAGTFPGNEKWEQCNSREETLYPRRKNLRSDFYRDYTRILHCAAYRRLKHKTQVFFATENDHICTRMEHVNHVASVSYTISKKLKLNTELTSAIAIGHDLGHAPFGHQGEMVLKGLARQYLNDTFWHEKNSLRFVDLIETLPDPNGCDSNLKLTYAVRDGIVSHCGEIDENGLRPRQEVLNLTKITEPNQVPPYTWEGCVVKIADKIAYLGRDIEDGISIGIITIDDAKKFLRSLKSEQFPKEERTKLGFSSFRELNNTVIMDELVSDLIENSNCRDGIRFSEPYYSFINLIKKFNYERIYDHPRLKYFKKYADLILTTIFDVLSNYFDGKNTKARLAKDEKLYPILASYFSRWLIKFSNGYGEERGSGKYSNKIIYDIDNHRDYLTAIIDFISGMTDSYAIKCFRELTTF